VVAHLAAGTDIPTLQRLGRWKSADVLLSTYAHMLPAAGGDAVTTGRPARERWQVARCDRRPEGSETPAA